ncbi:MAG: hypothetical protein ACOC5K_04610 [Chloroflexota bacterium]
MNLSLRLGFAAWEVVVLAIAWWRGTEGQPGSGEFEIGEFLLILIGGSALYWAMALLISGIGENILDRVRRG